MMMELMISKRNMLRRVHAFFLGVLVVLTFSSLPETEALSSSSVTIRVCTGSSCLGKCRGAFNPLSSLENLKKDEGEDGDIHIDIDIDIDIEETYCMNQCKKGPNARIIQNGNVLIFQDQMNEMEQKRKSFQGIGSDVRVNALWGIAKAVESNDESIVATDTGTSVEKLTDIMPAKAT